MEPTDTRLDRLRDPLSTPTRSARKALLVGATTGIVIVKAGLVPTEIAALGIQFQETDQQTLLAILGAIIIYFLIAFGLYAVSDLTSWIVATKKARAEGLDERAYSGGNVKLGVELGDDELRQAAEYAKTDYFNWRDRVEPITVVRALFDFGLPPAVAVYALYLVF